ncbi:hypothetical protein FHT44_004959 [Mycolicibacterium sp. BK634]|uniref:hypothetical protein n=1 Tax=Mycolicibacterium sp. BK634 TaxID=2587099 RepID=UPI0016079B9E|nr:hypothetical protein [Mycolicibacterium sp. BK634]MBB3752447.1 hypothetical protein [Mycolicibacterium sp. BK634]
MRTDLCKYQLQRVSPDGRHVIIYHRDEKKSFRYTFGEITSYVASSPVSDWADWPSFDLGAETIEQIRVFMGAW